MEIKWTRYPFLLTPNNCRPILARQEPASEVKGTKLDSRCSSKVERTGLYFLHCSFTAAIIETLALPQIELHAQAWAVISLWTTEVPYLFNTYRPYDHLRLGVLYFVITYAMHICSRIRSSSSGSALLEPVPALGVAIWDLGTVSGVGSEQVFFTTLRLGSMREL
jgi:hypothetical protein